MEIWSFLGGGGSLETSDLDLGEKVGNLDFLGGGSLELSDLDLGEKVGNLDHLGGIPGTSDLDLGQKVGTLDFGGVFWKLQIWT